MKPIQSLTMAGICLPMLLLAGCNEETPVAEKPRPVRTAAVAFVPDGESVTQTGTIVPRLETELGFQVSGRMIRRVVEVGDMVAAGDLIAAVDPVDIANEVKTAEADLAAAVAAETLTRSNVERQRLLLPKQATPKATAEAADADWRAAAAKREAAAAIVESARNKLRYADLRATGSGVVTAVGANAGQVVSAGQMVVRVATVAEKEAVFDVSESVVNTAPPHVVIRVSLLSDPSVSTTGRVREVSPLADDATRSYRVKVALPEAPSAMNLGATVTGAIVLPGKPVATLPATAVNTANGRPAVFVVDPSTGRLQLRPVAIDRYDERLAYVTYGLKAGERVVTAGVSKLRPDQVVAIEEGQ